RTSLPWERAEARARAAPGNPLPDEPSISPAGAACCRRWRAPEGGDPNGSRALDSGSEAGGPARAAVVARAVQVGVFQEAGAAQIRAAQVRPLQVGVEEGRPAQGGIGEVCAAQVRR